MAWDFDTRAKGWDADEKHLRRSAAVAEAIRAGVPVGSAMRVLEYGCGTGLLGFALRPHVGALALADSSDGMLEVLRAKVEAVEPGAGLRVLKWDGLADPPLAERFDLICTQMTLHHVLDTDRILRIFQEHLEPAGCLCVADLDTEDGSFHGPGFDGHLGFDRDDLGRRARRAGFADVCFSTAFQMDKEVAGGRIQTFPIFLMIARKG